MNYLTKTLSYSNKSILTRTSSITPANTNEMALTMSIKGKYRHKNTLDVPANDNRWGAHGPKR